MINSLFSIFLGLRADISYTINVYFETQWMYAGSTVEDDILTEKNYSLTNPLFPRAIVDVFHDRIEKALGNHDMGALNLKYPIYPTCEQPMLDEFEGGCVPSDSK